MKKILLVFSIISSLVATACEKNSFSDSTELPSDLPRTSVPEQLQGNWMYGNFSLTEYWSQNPSSYLGNALEFAIAFQFNANGTYVQYFTASSVAGGIKTYQQSVTRGTIEINTSSKTIKTHPFSSHYRRTSNGQTVEERDMTRAEMSGVTTYLYTLATEPNGTKAIMLQIQGSNSPLTFLKK